MIDLQAIGTNNVKGRDASRKGINRTVKLSLVLLIGLVGACVWCYGAFVDQREAAFAARRDFDQCRSLIDRIDTFRRKPTIAGAEEIQAGELVRRLERAARTSQIAPESLVRVMPEGAHRLGETNYKEKPTQVLLRNLTLRQLVGFLHALVCEDSGLEVKDIRLSAPREPKTGERWTAEVTLSYLIYAPSTGI